jgi:hypothetical protein
VPRLRAIDRSRREEVGIDERLALGVEIARLAAAKAAG